MNIFLLIVDEKEADHYLKEKDPKGYRLFHKAFSQPTADSIQAWILHVIAEMPGEGKDGAGHDL